MTPFAERHFAPILGAMALGICVGLATPHCAAAQGVMELEGDQGQQQPAYSPYDDLTQGGYASQPDSMSNAYEIEAEEPSVSTGDEIESLDDIELAPAPQAESEIDRNSVKQAPESGNAAQKGFDPFALQAGESADETAQPTLPQSNRPKVTPKAGTTATLRGLDKVTGRISEFQVGLDEPTRFGTLAIHLRYCQKAPPEETPEVAAFLQIDEERRDNGESERQFSGWMYASSPSVSAMEHPIYDVWVIDCSAVAPSSDFGSP